MFAMRGLVLMLLALSASLADITCHDENCEAQSPRVEVILYTNGGNVTGPQPVNAFLTIDNSSATIQNFIVTEGKRLGLYSDEILLTATLRTRSGEIITPSSTIVDGQDLYIVPDGHWYFYPALYVGFEIPVTLPTGEQYVLKTLSVRPRLFRISDFIKDEEISALIEYASDHFMISDTISVDGKRAYDTKVRTSQTSWVPATALPAAKALDERVANITGIPLDQGLEDQIQVLKYGINGHYHAHYDCIPPELAAGNPAVLSGVQRLLTFFYYLSDVPAGGETNFPYGQPNGYEVNTIFDYSDCSRGLSVKPEKGSAVLWYNLLAETHMEGELDRYSLHGGCDVLEGEKWSANKWLYNKKYNGGLWNIN